MEGFLIMGTNSVILNRLFTQNIFFDLVKAKDNAVYGSVVKRYISEAESKENGVLISGIYKMMSKNYRNEYIYKNTLLNKLLLGRHSVNTTTALTEIPINKSKADFIMINGKAVVYEIKTELDTFNRLENQINDYYKAFDHVCVVTSEDQYEKVCSILENSSVGICILTNRNTLSLRKEPIQDNSKLNSKVIFKLLHKREFERIILDYYGSLPETSPVFYYDECLEVFQKIPIVDAYRLTLKELKKRNKVIVEEFKKVPYELKSLIYFSKFRKKDYAGLDSFLQKKFGG